MYSVCDSHVHLDVIRPLDESVAAYKKIMEAHGFEKLSILPIPSYGYVINELYPECSDGRGYGYGENYEALYCKDVLSPRVYASMGICHNFNGDDTAEYYLDEIKRHYAMGCDGVKILQGKPGYYTKFKNPLDSEIYGKMYAFAEENGIPVNFHIGDPESFWDTENRSEWEFSLGRVYDENYPSLESLRTQILNILDKFPKLKVIIAHFNFMSNELDRASEMLDKYENLYFDLAPGGEMFVGFTKNYDKAKAFFEKYSDRILHGTDSSNDYSEHAWTHKALSIVRPFLEGTEKYVMECVSPQPLKPFGFSGEILDKIYGGNFKRLYGENPRPLNPELIASSIPAFIERFKDKLKPQGIENLKHIKAHFEK